MSQEIVDVVSTLLWGRLDCSLMLKLSGLGVCKSGAQEYCNITWAGTRHNTGEGGGWAGMDRKTA